MALVGRVETHTAQSLWEMGHRSLLLDEQNAIKLSVSLFTLTSYCRTWPAATTRHGTEGLDNGARGCMPGRGSSRLGGSEPLNMEPTETKSNTLRQWARHARASPGGQQAARTRRQFHRALQWVGLGAPWNHREGLVYQDEECRDHNDTGHHFLHQARGLTSRSQPRDNPQSTSLSLGGDAFSNPHPTEPGMLALGRGPHCGSKNSIKESATSATEHGGPMEQCFKH